MKTTKAIERAKIANHQYNLDLTKTFFELDFEEMQILDLLYDITGYDGRNNLGRSKLRQFYYHLQWGWKKYIEQLKKQQQSNQ